MTAQLVERLARLVDRAVWSGGQRGPEDAALLVLSDPVIADALRARDTLQQLRADHTWRQWSSESDARTCSCGLGNCPVARLTDAA